MQQAEVERRQLAVQGDRGQAKLAEPLVGAGHRPVEAGRLFGRGDRRSGLALPARGLELEGAVELSRRGPWGPRSARRSASWSRRILRPSLASLRKRLGWSLLYAAKSACRSMIGEVCSDSTSATRRAPRESLASAGRAESVEASASISSAPGAASSAAANAASRAWWSHAGTWNTGVWTFAIARSAPPRRHSGSTATRRLPRHTAQTLSSPRPRRRSTTPRTRRGGRTGPGCLAASQSHCSSSSANRAGSSIHSMRWTEAGRRVPCGGRALRTTTGGAGRREAVRAWSTPLDVKGELMPGYANSGTAYR